MGLLLLEIVAHAGAPLKDLIADLQQQYGPHHYARKDLPLARPVAKKDMVKRLTDGAPGAIGGVNVCEVRSNDGVKYLLDDDSWLLIRPSGTNQSPCMPNRCSALVAARSDMAGRSRQR
jgi:phosphomannomutase